MTIYSAENVSELVGIRRRCVDVNVTNDESGASRGDHRTRKELSSLGTEEVG